MKHISITHTFPLLDNAISHILNKDIANITDNDLDNLSDQELQQLLLENVENDTMEFEGFGEKSEVIKSAFEFVKVIVNKYDKSIDTRYFENQLLAIGYLSVNYYYLGFRHNLTIKVTDADENKSEI